MTITKTLLTATTALTLSMGAAYAGSGNEAYLDQNGASNSASVDQSAGNNNEAGSSVQNMTQIGELNSLTIKQSGNNNDIGLGANADSAAVGLKQTQNGSPSGTRNSMSVTQTSDGNVVGSAVQTAGGSHGVGNRLTIAQGGGGGNTIGSVYQRRSSSVSNLVDITQNGTNNTLDRVSQDARVGGSANPNEIKVTMEGSDNGADDFTGGGAAAASGAISSNLVQGTDLGTKGNKIDITVAGTSNEFGISQYGNNNKAVGITFGVGSADNELGIYQKGASNEVALSSIDGVDNRLGIRQIGDFNMASLTVNGNENGGFHGFGSNAAGTLASSMGLTAGLIDQNGLANKTTLTVSGNGNVFAMLQNNNVGGTMGNTIVGNQDNSVGGGAGNQAAVAQVGDNNTASFNQVGSGNITAISQ